MRVFILTISMLLMFFATTALAAEDYICAMHPHIHGKEGDRCPICGMELVPAPNPNPVEGEAESPADALDISPDYVQALGVRTAKAALADFGRNVQGYGRIVPSTRAEYRVSLRKGGWIRELNTSAVGDRVKAGDVLFTFYSPELIAAESEYLTGQRTGFRQTATDSRLRLFGMDEKAIGLFKKTGSVIEEVPFHAPADGVVTVLDARKGAYIGEGAPILTIQDFSQVWVDAKVLLKDLQFLSAGTPAVVTVAQTGEKFSSAVDYIFPVADPESREGMVRLILDNPDGTLKAEAPVSVTFTVGSRPRLAVPEEAVLQGGGGAYVMEDFGGGRFLPVRVETGITADGQAEITSGLSEGQSVVISGQFMLDAESNLRGGMTNMSGAKDGGHSHGQ